MWMQQVKANFIGFLFLSFLIASFFLLINYFHDEIKITAAHLLLCGTIYVGWCGFAMYIYNLTDYHAVSNKKNWFRAIFLSIALAIFWAATGGLEMYLFKGSISIKNLTFSTGINVIGTLVSCPGLTFVALSGYVRAIFIEKVSQQH